MIIIPAVIAIVVISIMMFGSILSLSDFMTYEEHPEYKALGIAISIIAIVVALAIIGLLVFAIIQSYQ